ncbi:phenoloxidase-activating factor 3-like, partial [Pollicipes pollicipes]
VGGREVCTEPVQDFGIEKIIPHEEHHRPVKYRNDIALVRLDRPVRRTNYVRPICLPFDASVRRAHVGQELTVAGFGAIRGQGDTVRELTVPVVGNKECSQVYRSYRTLIGAEQICAGGERDRGACAGDAGGPLMAMPAPGQPHYLIGVVSFGPARCGTRNVPDVYTRVTEYEQWIVSNMRD